MKKKKMLLVCIHGYMMSHDITMKVEINAIRGEKRFALIRQNIRKR